MSRITTENLEQCDLTSQGAFNGTVPQILLT